MVCNKCGQVINDQVTSCPFCNNPINVTNNVVMSVNNTVVNNVQPVSKSPILIQKDNKESGGFNYTILSIILLVIAVGGLIYVIIQSNSGGFYFSFEETDESNEAINEVIDTETNKQYVAVSKSGQDGKQSGRGVTKVIFDNQYLEQTILNSTDEVKFFIELDNNNNDLNCPDEIKQIEENIEKNYGIVAVNLCEMNISFARELEGVAAYIYNTYPDARGKITNMTLANVGEDVTYMAAFMPIFTFVTSNTSSLYPLGIRTQILLNAKYFLDEGKLQSSVRYGAMSGYFPKNATRSSTVAHEFGHYLSYVAMMNYYKVDNLTFVRTKDSSTLMKVHEDFKVGSFSNMVIKEAYDNYINNYGGTMYYDQFRASISKYAVAKNSYGAYIYDETIAEAFHDVYLNKDNAALASKLIMESLMKYIIGG